MPSLFTVIVEFAGGNYTSQIDANSVEEALRNWAISFAADSETAEIAKTLFDDNSFSDGDEKPVPLDGLSNVWCTSFLSGSQLALVNFVLTER